MTISINKPTFITDTDIRSRVVLVDVEDNATVWLSIKETADTNESILYFETIKASATAKVTLVIEKPIHGLKEDTEYILKATIKVGTVGTITESATIPFRTKKSYLEQYKTNLGEVFTQLTQEGSIYQSMVKDMMDQVDKFSFDDFERAQLMANYMAQITAAMTQEASRTAITIVDKEKSSAKSGELTDLTTQEMAKKVEFEEAQITSTLDSVKHNLLIKILNGQEQYALAMAGNSIVPQAVMHTNYYMGVKEGYRWAGLTYGANGEIFGTDGTQLGTFATTALTTT